MRYLKSKPTSVIATVLFLGIFIWYFLTNTEDFKLLLDLSALPLIGLVVGHLLSLVSNGLIIKWIMEPFDKYITMKDSFYVSLISSAGNFFLPVGSGTGFRAVFLKNKYGLSYKNFFSTLYGNYIIVFFISSISGIMSILALGGLSNKNSRTLLLVFSFIAFITLALSIFRMDSMKRGMARIFGKPGRIIGEISTGWNFIIQHKRLLYKLMFSGLLSFMASLLISYSAFTSLSIQINAWSLVLYSALGSLTLLINISPGAIGIKEGIYIFSSSILMLTTPEILSASVIDRTIRFAILFIGWLALKNDFKYKPTE